MLKQVIEPGQIYEYTHIDLKWKFMILRERYNTYKVDSWTCYWDIIILSSNAASIEVGKFFIETYTTILGEYCRFIC